MYIDTEKAILVIRHGKVNQEKGYWHKGNMLKNNLLVILTEGNLTMQIGNKSYTVNSGDALLIPKQTFYRPLKSTGCEYYFFHFSCHETQPRETESEIKIKPNYNLPDGNYSFLYVFESNPIIKVNTQTTNFDIRIHNVLDRVRKTNVWQSDTEKFLLDCYVRELLTLLSADTSHLMIIDPNLRKIVRYLEMNFREAVSLSTLSDKFHLSQSFIARLFKRQLGTCTADFINSLRIRYACDLLINSKLSIGEISSKAGFNNQYYFSKVFKARNGITPSEFRKNQLK